MSKVLAKVMKSTSCENCRKCLVDDTSQETANNHLFREHQKADSLLDLPYLSRNIERYFNRLEFIFQRLSSLTPAHNKKFKRQFLINADHVMVPDEHCFKTTSTIISVFLSSRLNLRLHSYQPHKALKAASKSLV